MGSPVMRIPDQSEAAEVGDIDGLGPCVKAHRGAAVGVAEPLPGDGQGPHVGSQDGADGLDAVNELDRRNEHWISPFGTH